MRLDRLITRLAPARVGTLALMVAAAFVAVLATVTAGPTHAEPPSRLATQVYDPANVLSGSQRAQLEARLEKLAADHQIQLWVAYVNDFEGLSATTWSERTMAAGNLGYRDVLLSVATDERSYYLDVPEPIEELDRDALNSIARNDVEPQLSNDDWLGAGLGAANGLTGAIEGSNAGLVTAGVVGGVVVVGGGGALLYSRRRKRRGIEKGIEDLREQDTALTADQLAAQPLEVLDPWSREVLTDTDNAIRTSEEELRLAVSEFGTVQTAPFARAVEEARAGVATSFALRQRLDDNIPETPSEQRSMLVQIITTCTDVDNSLDEQVAAFDEMRNLLINAPGRFDQITQRLVELRARLETAGARVTELTAKHGESTVASIAANPQLAEQQIVFAENSADQGRDAIAQPAGSQGPAVAAIRSAEGAIDQATKLLDAIDHADENIAAAHTQMPALIAEVEGELAEAAGLSVDGGPQLVTAVSTANEALTRARGSFDDDPLGTFSALVDADAELDDALDAARAASAERKRRAELLTSAISAATAKVSAAADFIATRRGAIGATARTRLSESQRLLDEANATSASNPVGAIEAARRAGSLADQALMAAQGDVAQWQQAQAPRQRPADSIGGAVLTGILVDSFLRGGMRGGGFGGGGFGGGGYSSGGRSPGSFGGSSSSGRIGVGGRF